jgi:phosphatidylinositol-bisphosphatase
MLTFDQEVNKYAIKLKQNEDKYMDEMPLKIFCGTYNLNGKLIDESLFSWFCKHEHCDIYVLGFQELCELSTSTFLLASDWNEKESNLLECLQKDLGSKELIAKCRLWGIVLYVYARKKLVKHIKDVSWASVATGILNTLGNKGTVGISMKVYDTRVCFLCSHFASDTSQLERRNADYRYTCENLRFEVPNQRNEFLDIDSHSIIFWLGDFNYRIETLSLSETLSFIADGNFETLLEFDQLTRQLNKKRVFVDYREGSLHFKPTYKYTVKSDVYDMITNANGIQTVSGRGSSTAKPKLPSWTDRVLWKCMDSNDMVELVQYSAIQTITISDHKPVYGIFNVKLKQINKEKHRKYLDSLLKESDRKQNEDRPKIKLLSDAELNFGSLSFYQTKTMEIELKNDGQTNVSFDTFVHFVHPKDGNTLKFEENHFGPNAAHNQPQTTSISTLYNQWFKIKPYKLDSFKPNSIVKIQLSVDFNQYNLVRLNRRLHLEDILVIKCLGGNDLFVNIVCDYVPTIIGASLKALGTLSQPFVKCDMCKFFNQTEENFRQTELLVDCCAVQMNTHFGKFNLLFCFFESLSRICK